ncbi:MAG: serine hydrolase domain-containing protein [bacterium]
MSTIIQGTCDARFVAVREAFTENFAERREVGAAFSLYVEGRCVVDLWGGHRDQAKTEAWEPDTIVNVYSTTKAMAALCAHQLVEEGLLDLDAPVAKYWPEFAAAGKQGISVRQLLCHQAGLAAVREPLPDSALYDWDAMVRALAAEKPWWEPGSAHGYHAVTFGWLVGEVVRRITGESLGTTFRRRIAEPLGADFQIGVPDADHCRIAEMSPMSLEKAPDEPALAEILMSDPEGVAAKAFMNPASMALGPNVPAWRRAEIPGANGHATARGLARIYGALGAGGSLDGVHVLAKESIERCRTEHSSGADLVLQTETRFGLGFMLTQDRPGASFGPNTGAFGHPGAGGSLGMTDPEAGIGFGYVMNFMGPHILLDPRARELIRATYASLG